MVKKSKRPIHQTKAERTQAEADRRRRAGLARNPAYLRDGLVGAVERRVEPQAVEQRKRREDDERLQGIKAALAKIKTKLRRERGGTLFGGVLTRSIVRK